MSQSKPMAPAECGSGLVYEIRAASGRRYAIYRASVLGLSLDREPDGWHFTPVPVLPDFCMSGPFASSSAAESAALRSDSELS